VNSWWLLLSGRAKASPIPFQAFVIPEYKFIPGEIFRSDPGKLAGFVIEADVPLHTTYYIEIDTVHATCLIGKAVLIEKKLATGAGKPSLLRELLLTGRLHRLAVIDFASRQTPVPWRILTVGPSQNENPAMLIRNDEAHHGNWICITLQVSRSSASVSFNMGIDFNFKGISPSCLCSPSALPLHF
jgi:hypothetical protein